MDKAVEDLTTVYVPEFSAFLAGATGCPMDAVTGLVTDHVLQTKAVVDAQAAGTGRRPTRPSATAYAHMQMIGDALAPAIAEKQPDMFDGDPSTRRGRLPGRSQPAPPGAPLPRQLRHGRGARRAQRRVRRGRRGAQHQRHRPRRAPSAALYGDEAEDEFNRIWSAHNGFFVDYTTGVATEDQAKRTRPSRI